MIEQIEGDTEAITALRRRKVDGEPYSRPPEIERLLAGLVRLPEEEALARAAIRRRSAAGWLPGECLVHMMRRAGRRQDRRAYNQWCAVLLGRIGTALPQHGGRNALLSDVEMAEYILDRFVTLLGPDLEGYDERLDIWEARFDLALANLRRDALRRELAGGERESIEIADDGAQMAEIERALLGFDPLHAFHHSDEDFRSRIWAAIDALPVEQNRILTMMRAGLPVGSGTPGENSISGILGRSPRTILNQKLRAFSAVREAVEGEGL